MDEPATCCSFPSGSRSPTVANRPAWLPCCCASPLPAAPADTDKMIGLQLFLDVQEFGRQAKQVRRGPGVQG